MSYQLVDTSEETDHVCGARCTVGEHYRRVVTIPSDETFRERAQHLLGERRIRHRVGPVFAIEGAPDRTGATSWYDVDVAAGTCTCPWSEHHPNVRCKHVRFFEALRALFAAFRQAYEV